MAMVGLQFHLVFASEPLDFGSAILELGPGDDICEQGHILISNSVAQWDTSAGQDVMTVTFSVNDGSVQVALVQGLLSFVRNLPPFQRMLENDGILSGKKSNVINSSSSWVDDEVRDCLVEAAINDTRVAKELSTGATI